MPRTLRVPSYRLHRPSGQAVVTLSGRDHYLGQFDTPESREEYDRLVAEWIASGRRPLNVATSLTIAELVLKYLDHAEAYYGTAGPTTSEYRCLCDAVKPLVELYARTSANDFGPLALKAVRQRMIDRGWARKHINRQISRIRRVFRWGVENEIVGASTLHALQAVAALKAGRTEAPETNRVLPVPDDHVDAVLPHVSPQVAAMIELQRKTGARAGEIIQLRPCDVDRSGEIWIFRPARHKTQYAGRDREIYLGPEAQKILTPWLDRPDDAFCFSPAEAEAARNASRRAARRSPMTPSQAARKPKTTPRRPKRDHYTVSAYRRAIVYGIGRAKSTHWHPHQLRHAFATVARAKFGLDVVQVLLGHATADTTQIYAQADRERAASAVRNIG